MQSVRKSAPIRLKINDILLGHELTWGHTNKKISLFGSLRTIFSYSQRKYRAGEKLLDGLCFWTLFGVISSVIQLSPCNHIFFIFTASGLPFLYPTIATPVQVFRQPGFMQRWLCNVQNAVKAYYSCLSSLWVETSSRRGRSALPLNVTDNC